MRYFMSFISAVGFLFATATTAQAMSPAGTWISIDDKTNKPRSVIVIKESNGNLTGTIRKVFKQPGDTGICSKCPGKFKGKPIQGLTILWGFKKKDDFYWKSGQILDPKNGKIYSSYIKLSKDGKRLKVRGYLGISLLGRTQTWYRR